MTGSPLPEDLALEVVGYVAADRSHSIHSQKRTQSTLSALTRTCTTFRIIAIKELYESIYLSSTSALAQLVKALGKKPHLCYYARSLSYGRFVEDPVDSYRYTDREWHNLVKLHKLCAHLSLSSLKASKIPNRRLPLGNGILLNDISQLPNPTQ